MMTKSERAKRATYILEGIAALLLLALVASVTGLHLTRPPIRYTAQAASQEVTVQARVLNIEQQDIQTDDNGLIIVNQRLVLDIISSGEHQGKQVIVDYHGMGPTERAAAFKSGQRALVMVSTRPDGEQFFAVADHVRLLPLAVLTAVLMLITLLIGRWQGARALIGLGLSGLLIGGFMLPQILAHRDPVLIAITGTALLLAVTLYLIQGWNPIAHTSLIAMLVGLAATGALAIAWTQIAHLTGFGSEETLYLQAIGVGVEMRGLLLAGIIIGAAGVLDDIVLAQAVTIFELYDADPTSPRRDLYQRGMKIGLAHLASMINTLVLAYASTALPLIILFYLYPEPWYLTINRELIAEEVIRALVGSLGVMLAVPLTTLIATWAAPIVYSVEKPVTNPHGKQDTTTNQENNESDS